VLNDADKIIMRGVEMMEKVKLYINGSYVDGSSGEQFATYSPSSGEKIAEIVKGNRVDAQMAIRSANENKHRIAKLTVWERSKILRDIADNLGKRKEEVAAAVAMEQGKNYYAEALIEVDRAIEGLANASEQIKWYQNSVISVKDPTKRVWTVRQPKGVYAVITPWNMPINIPIEYIAPGLATGNAVIWLPAPSVSYCTSKLMECIIEADIPQGVIQFLTGPGQEVGDELVINPGVHGIGFTGSSQTGDIIARRGYGKSMTLELGGNGPTIIMEDAVIGQREINAIASAAFMNGGQICTATARILVHKSREEEVTEGLAKYARSITVGESFDRSASMGPLHNEGICQKMDEHVTDAVVKGADIVVGGKRISGFKTNLFYEPTVLRNVSAESLINCEETFGPVVPLISYSDDQELRDLIDKSTLGLSSSIFSSDYGRAILFAEEIQTGSVVINDRSNYWELHIPFGGISGKTSGRGRLGGFAAIEAMTDSKTISMTVK
jgi:acyl-CoA reductase-like NAD-dependent aldehyde dehydrogenase